MRRAPAAGHPRGLPRPARDVRGTRERTIEAARTRRAEGEWTAESLTLFTQATLQGAFIVAKSARHGAAAAPLLAHLRAYVQGLLGGERPASTPTSEEQADESGSPMFAGRTTTRGPSTSARSAQCSRC